MQVEDLSNVEVGDLVRWNGRTNPQVVTKVTESWFEVRSHSDSYYRFYPQDRNLVNQQSETEYDINQFEVLGEVYDVNRW